MRERLIVNINISFCNRITPACAGRTLPLPAYIHPNEDHPRSRGKDYTLSFSYSVRSGSPPLAREGRNWRYCGQFDDGITPARAGRTHTISLDDEICQDHPRSRGKDVFFSVSVTSLLGSPPLAREGQPGFRHLKEPTKITPARAGRTDSFVIGKENY